jgi:hypothetical protein
MIRKMKILNHNRSLAEMAGQLNSNICGKWTQMNTDMNINDENLEMQ